MLPVKAIGEAERGFNMFVVAGSTAIQGSEDIHDDREMGYRRTGNLSKL